MSRGRTRKNAEEDGRRYGLDTLQDAVVGCARLVWMMLREIFDERAYDRYLLRTDTSRGGESYRAFSSECSAQRAGSARCC